MKEKSTRIKKRNGIYFDLQSEELARVEAYRRRQNLTTNAAAIRKLALDQLDQWETARDQTQHTAAAA